MKVNVYNILWILIQVIRTHNKRATKRMNKNELMYKLQKRTIRRFITILIRTLAYYDLYLSYANPRVKERIKKEYPLAEDINCFMPLIGFLNGTEAYYIRGTDFLYIIERDPNRQEKKRVFVQMSFDKGNDFIVEVPIEDVLGVIPKRAGESIVYNLDKFI